MGYSTTKNIDDDGLLASLIKSGNKEAFRQFYNLYSKRIYGFALSYLKSPSEAEEIIQAVFVKIWETRSDIRDNVPLRSYLYTITINHIYNLLKFKKVRGTPSSEIIEPLEVTDNSTLEKIQFNNLQENINTLIDQLPEQRKVIFKLSRIDGYSHEEIAKKLQISVRTVESQIYKALKFLKSNLKEDLVLLLFLIQAF